MKLQLLFRKRVCVLEWFPEHPFLQAHALRLPACDGAPDTLQSFSEPALAEPIEVICCGPPQVWVREVQWWLAILLEATVGKGRVVVEGGEGPKVAGVRKEKVKDELGVESPVARIVEDENSIYLQGFGELCF